MQKRRREDGIKPEKLVVDIDELCDILSMGRASSMKLAEEARARLDLDGSRLVRFSVKRIEEYLETITY